MTAAILFTVVLLPLYLLVREPFRRLPLHIDTGFYVSNHTVATRRFSYRAGWNAHYAGCSKVIPELFYSMVYLLHEPARRGGGAGGRRGYKRMSRFYASLYNYTTAVAVGVLAYALTGGDIRYYYAGLVVFAMLSSEPHYGVYFECAELLELLPQVISLLLVSVGLNQTSGWLIGLGAFIWLSEALFIKLSSIIAYVVLFGGLSLLHLWTWPGIIGGGGVAAGCYLAWLLWNRQSPVTLVRHLRGHERCYDQWTDWRGLGHRLYEKARCLTVAIRRQPLLPAMAVIGLFVTPSPPSLFWLYLAAVVAVYLAQATDCRYYLVLLLPPIALLCAGCAVSLASIGAVGIAALVAIATAWLTHNPLRAARLDAYDLNLWCWEGSQRDYEATRNLALERFADEAAPIVAGRTLLVHGPLNQAYVLLNASYATPTVAPEYYLDHVCPGWQRRHNADLVESPPAFILDTSASFDAEEARTRLGLEYHLTHLFGSEFRLHELKGVAEPAEDYEEVQTFRAQSGAALRAQEQRAGTALVRYPLRADEHAHTDGRAHDKLSGALGELLHTLPRQGYRRLALYGAGRFTIRHANVYREADARIAMVLDDNAARHGDTFLDWPLRSPNDVDPRDFDAVIVSTDRFAGPILARIRRRWGDRVPAFTVTT